MICLSLAYARPADGVFGSHNWHAVGEHDPTTATCGKFSEQIKLRGSGGWPTPWMLAPAGVNKRVLKPE